MTQVYKIETCFFGEYLGTNEQTSEKNEVTTVWMLFDRFLSDRHISRIS